LAVFVLVHPAWFGGWCWKKLVPLLEDHGHSVRTPTLTGLGERSHLAHPGIVMPTHIDDVASVLIYDDLREVILAGTSSSGAVARLRPTPFGHFTSPVRLANPAAERLPRTYIRCRGFPHPGFDRYAQAASQDPCWRLLHLDSSHLPYITSPHELAPMLLELAAS
jgi:hypothetical protein